MTSPMVLWGRTGAFEWQPMRRARPTFARRPAAAALLLLAAGAVIVGCAAAAQAQAPSIEIVFPVPAHILGASLGERYNGSVVVNSLVRVTDIDTPLDNVSLSWSLTPDFPSLAGQNTVIETNRSNASEIWARIILFVPDGAYTLTWTADDAGGGVTSQAVSFTADSHAPYVSVDLPAVTRVQNLTVYIDIQDPLSDINASTIVVQFRSSCSSSWAVVPMQSTLLPGRVSGVVELHLCAGLSNSLQLSVADRAGNAHYGLVATVTLDQQAPTMNHSFPWPFSILEGNSVNLTAAFADDYSGVDASTVQLQVSKNGGVTYSDWLDPEVRVQGGIAYASYAQTFSPGQAAAVRWRAFDKAGNGPGPMQPIHFQMNGEPFLISYEPVEGKTFLEGQRVPFAASFADPDADFVNAEFYSDIDGYLGSVSGFHNITPVNERFTHVLSLGVHNISIVGDDNHGHRVTYVYQLEILPRPPPDYRFFLLIPMLLALMAADRLILS